MEDTTQILLAEWKEIRETLRYFGNKRFAQLTVFIATTGFMVNTLITNNSETSAQTIAVLRLAGIALGILFLIMERRSAEYITAFAKRGEDVEERLKEMGTMKARPKKHGLGKLLTGTWATYILYILVILYWLLPFAHK